MLSVPVMDAKYIASSYLFWPEARVNGLMRPIATPGWTLNLEMMFYAVFAVALLLPRRLGLGFALLLLGGMAAAHVAGVFAPGGALPSPVLNFWSDPIITGFMLGMGVGILFVHGCRQSFWTMLVLAIVGMVWLLNVPSRPDLPEDDLWVRLSSAIPATIVLAALAFGPQLGLHLRWKWLFAPLLLIGDASYSLYLTHEFLLRPLRVVWQKFTADLLPLWSFLPIGIAISILGGLACYWLFEKPVTNWLSRRLRQRRAIVASDPLTTRAA
jgi:peptidoglycan/LPS O-acetylase OafA/YrhL